MYGYTELEETVIKTGQFTDQLLSDNNSYNGEEIYLTDFQNCAALRY